MNTIICLTETPVWHQGYIKHHLRNPGINMTGSFKGNRLVVNDIYEILFINPVGIYSNDDLFVNCVLDLTDPLQLILMVHSARKSLLLVVPIQLLLLQRIRLARLQL